VVGFIATLPFQASLNAANAAATAALETQVAQQKQEQLNKLKASLDQIGIAAKDYVKVGADLEQAKNEYRKVLMEMAKAMDNTGGRKGKKFQTMAAFLGEAEAYLAQSRATKDLAKNEMQTAANAKASRGNVTLATGEKECKWWDIKEEKQVANSSKHYVLGKHEVHLPVGAKAQSANGGAEGDEGANAAIEKELERLDKNEGWIGKMRDKLKTQFSF
jgi:enamine deaminase RidA (YjgF/YER057c/UK114 family)